MDQESTRKDGGFRPWEELMIYIYDQQLQLIYRGQYREGQDSQFKHILKDCSLLFNLNKTSYYLKNS